MNELVFAKNEESRKEVTIRIISSRKATKHETKKYGDSKMRKEYDFSKGERGKFYRRDMKLNISIYVALWWLSTLVLIVPAPKGV